MATAAVAQNRLSLWLISKGYFVGESVPLKQSRLLNLMRELYPVTMKKLEEETRERGELFIKICGSFSIPIAERRTLAQKEVAEENGKLRKMLEKQQKQKPKHDRLQNPAVSIVTQSGSDSFLQSYEWRRLRMQAIKLYGSRCQCCGASPKTGATINVDHIKPRKIYPDLALSLDNLQVLCHECNHGKGNWDMTDWRTKAEA